MCTCRLADKLQKNLDRDLYQIEIMRSFLFLSFAFLLLSVEANCQGDVQRTKQFNLNKGIALSGYDPVSYYNGKPMKGRSDLSYAYKDVVYYFAVRQNLEKFKQNPAGYEPQYGGWCAYAMGNTGEKVEVDPETYKIIGGKLYLFYNKYFNNTLKSWNKNESYLKQRADANWQKVFH